jgi:hypothetical protein
VFEGGGQIILGATSRHIVGVVGWSLQMIGKSLVCLLRVWRAAIKADFDGPYSAALELLREPLGFGNLRGSHTTGDSNLDCLPL